MAVINVIDQQARSQITDLRAQVTAGAAFKTGTVTVSAAATSIAITISPAFSSATYKVGISTDWNTTIWITGKTRTGFTVNFGTLAPSGGGHVDWRIDA